MINHLSLCNAALNEVIVQYIDIIHTSFQFLLYGLQSCFRAHKNVVDRLMIQVFTEVDNVPSME